MWRCREKPFNKVFWSGEIEQEPVTRDSKMQLTWEHRLALWLPGPSLLGFLMVAGFLIASYLSLIWFFKQEYVFVERLPIIIALFIAFMLMVPRYLAAPRQHLPLDGGITPPNTQMTAVALQLPAKELRNSRFAAVAGVLFVLGITEVIEIMKGADIEALIFFYFHVHNGVLTLPLSLTMGWLLGRGGYLTIALMSTNDLRLPASSEIDLLNLDHLYIIGRSGLRGSLVCLLTISIASLILLDTPIGLWGMLPAFASGFVGGLFILFRPARAVRNLIRFAKRNELARLGPKVLKARDDALLDDMPTQGRLTDLLAYKNSITAIPEWSFDSPTLMRFGLYLLLPVGSMIAGTFIERIIDSLVG